MSSSRWGKSGGCDGAGVDDPELLLSTGAPIFLFQKLSQESHLKTAYGTDLEIPWLAAKR
jgi:hypothetical protein